MPPFQLLSPQSVPEAVALLSAAEGSENALPIAGGSDLLSEIKEGVARPGTLVSLAAIPDLRGITVSDKELTIGSAATIAEIAEHPIIRDEFTALAQAAAGLATPQIRNVGTLGGNLNQRPRCWYYRHPLTNCLKKGGSHCFAIAGNSKYLCLTGGDRCYIVHPSDTAVALLAFNAVIDTAGPNGNRSIPIGDYFTSPSHDITRENCLQPGEILTRIRIPRLSAGTAVRRSLYLKAREREAGDFALVSVAAVIDLHDTPEGSAINRAAVTLGGVAPVPYRASQAEDYLTGQRPSAIDPSHAGSLTLPDGRPLTQNAYKLPMTRNLIHRAVARLLIGST